MEQSTPYIRERLQTVFREVFDDAKLKIDDTMTAADIEGWDSLNHITLVLAVEKAFQIRLHLAEVARLEDVGAFVRLIAERATS
jgi:acyl carrier protein